MWQTIRFGIELLGANSSFAGYVIALVALGIAGLAVHGLTTAVKALASRHR